MDQNSEESRSVEAMSIFGQSIDVRRPVRSRRRATQKKFSPAGESPASPSVERLHVHQRRPVAERERPRAEAELSRASTMASELERQLEQANAKARSHRWESELQRTRAAGSGGSRSKKVLADAEAPGAVQAQDQSNSLYVEVMHELDSVKRELRKLQREVEEAREAKAEAEAERDAETPTPRVLTSGSRPLDRVKREAGEENEDRGISELAEADGSRKGMQSQDTWTRVQSLQKDTSRASDPDERFATASSSDVGLEPAEMAMVPATGEADHVENGESALTVTRHGEHDDRSSLQAAAEAELTSARIELESIKEEGIRFTNSTERTRREKARVAEEIDRLTEQEKRASAQVQQLSARLVRARSRLDAATAADERAEAMLSKLSAALRQLGEETEAAEKERELMELENRCVREHAETVGAEIAASEQRIRESVKELEAARASEAAATVKLRAIVGSATQARAAAMSQRSGSVTIPRFEYEYLTGRTEVVRAVAVKKVAAAEAWVEALRAGEKEVVMRAEAI
ncbi:hypothetical protein GQ55_3G181000 [Panicum hallii var. hallii]|uniref:Uncharacterized protein n=1 Tax=Panicum hallii var. hallii TaxID=1504633 RepID=A0A2T7EAR8_9POAL|nr:hypothetical protein GQ55_3G181000 [Panicum hallii var. hallii]PUZ64912.1 hypothetical protein GQ55_3G181000 [Panicum hallii var. hallii]PUZ64913.1 hypothetical protein GQ55_3G181000 [Panicum hallii var. hallii]